MSLIELVFYSDIAAAGGSTDDLGLSSEIMFFGKLAFLSEILDGGVFFLRLWEEVWSSLLCFD